MNAGEAIKFANQLILNKRIAKNESKARYTKEFTEEAENNRLVLERFRKAAAPMVSVLKSMSKEPAARFSVFETVQLEEPKGYGNSSCLTVIVDGYEEELGKYPKPKEYIIQMKGFEKDSSKELYINIRFDMYGYVDVSNHKIDQLYKDSACRLCLGIPPSYKVRPESIDTDKILPVVIKGLVDMKLYDCPTP